MWAQYIGNNYSALHDSTHLVKVDHRTEEKHATRTNKIEVK